MTTATETAPVKFTVTRQWILAGKAIFTVHNATGKHYTFRISRPRKTDETKPPVWFASLLSGPDNDDDDSYLYLGLLCEQTAGVRLTRKSRVTEQSPALAVLRWALRRVWRGEPLPAGYGIDGEGRCGKCGRLLTHPDGVSNDGPRFGFGPVCWERMQKGGAE